MISTTEVPHGDGVHANTFFLRILDLLFKFYVPWCLRIVPALFLRDMYLALRLPASHTPQKTAHYSPMLHNALIALATAFSDNPHLRNLKTRLTFLEKAKSYIDIECDCPNISVVSGLAMIGNFYSSMAQQGLGYLYFGSEFFIPPASHLTL